MRLVCPNCDARYEVPDDAIPEAGRDVQCANCGHAWYQMRSGALAAEADAPAPVETPAEASAEAPAASPAAVDDGRPQAPEPAPVLEEKTFADHEDTPIEAAPPLPEPTHPPASDYAVDDSVLAILREEAERETRARQQEARPLETQADLGIVPAATPAQKRAAMLKAEEAALKVEDAAARPSARRDLLPNVDEINSTLRPSETAPDPDAEVAALPDLTRGRNSFRSGFMMMMLVALIGLVAYLAAPRLSAQFPGLTGPLTAYVGFVDVIRLQLDGLMQSATVALTGDAG